MKRLLYITLSLLTLCFSLSSCEKETDDYESDPLNDYILNQVGKYISYRLDSTVFVNFGQKDSTIYYQAKDVVEESFTDQAGKAALRVVRYLRDTSGTTPWLPSITYVIVPGRETVEVVENNFRFLKLALPVKEGFSWKGNTYVNLNSSDPDWDYDYLFDWDYTYENYGQSFTTFKGQPVENTVTVNQRDEVIGVPNDPNGYSEKNYSKEIYAKGIGLVFREFLHTEYQPGNPGYTNGYGIRLTMIDHN
jgi:hypothetical protein